MYKRQPFDTLALGPRPVTVSAIFVREVSTFTLTDRTAFSISNDAHSARVAKLDLELYENMRVYRPLKFRCGITHYITTFSPTEASLILLSQLLHHLFNLSTFSRPKFM